MLLVIEKVFLLKHLEKCKVLGHIYVLALVLLGFVIFNGAGLSGAISDLGGLFGAGGIPLVSADALYYLKSYALLLLAAVLGSMPFLRNGYTKLREQKWMAVVEPVLVGCLLLLCTAYLVDGSFNPFLYFRF